MFHKLGSTIVAHARLVLTLSVVALAVFAVFGVGVFGRLVLSNALTLGATLGAMVWIFQFGHLSGILGFTPTPTSTAMPVLLFCIAFGLSMDYEVFVMSRIKELHDAARATPTP